MQVGHHVDALKADLAAVAAVGDEAVRDAADRLSQALEATLGLRLLDMLTEAANEVSAQLPSGYVEVRLSAQEPSLLYVEHEHAQAPPPWLNDEANTRMTLRLPESLKTAAETSAASEGLSVNAWLVRAVSRAVSVPAARVGRHLTGFARS